MSEKVDEIVLVPAVFVKYREDGNVLLKCLQDEEVVYRAFEPILFEGIENPNYLLLGLMTAENTMTLTICDGSDFENIYQEKWNVLLKD